MRLRLAGRSRVALAAAALLICALAAAWAYLRSVDAERRRVAGLDGVLVERETLSPPNAAGVTLWLADEAPVDVEPYGGAVYAATSSGLEVYDEAGRLTRRYTTLDGLPENTLTCLERYGDALYIGTAASGLVAFDGERFTRYRFVRPAASRVSALATSGGELLVGTFDAGLFEFDGESFSRRVQAAAGDGCRRVTALLGDGPRVYVGTYDAGLFEWREGRARAFTKADGLASDRVTGLALDRSRLLVATDLAVASLDESGRVAPVEAAPNATGVAVRGDAVYVASLTRGVAALAAQLGAPIRPVADRGAAQAGLAGVEALGLKSEDGVLWAMTREGLYASLPSDGPARFEPFGDRERARTGPSSGHVAALALDDAGRLWAGHFDGGVDLLDPATGARVERIADPALREINAIVSEKGSGKTWVASSKGLALFEGTRRSRTLGEREGLAGENVAALALGAGPGGGAVAVATNRGASFVDGAVARTLTAFHGLPNNHAYAVATLGGRTYVGTLGGLAEVDALRVARVFTTSSSALPHNWVNALAALDGRLYVGTYGGGVAALTASGELRAFDETAGLEVNPGAMLAVGRRLYAGTLDAGLYALDVDTGRWTRVAAALSSVNVTALAADDTYLYVGTEHGITRIERSALS